MNEQVDRRTLLTLWGIAVTVTEIGLVWLGAHPLIIATLTVWLILWLCAFWDLRGPTTDRITRALRDPRFKQIYQYITVRPFDRLWDSLCDRPPKNASFAQTFHAALTSRLYDRALLIAVLYPILLLTLWWFATGQPGQLGLVTVLQGIGPWWDVWPERLGFIVAIAIFLAGNRVSDLAARSPKRLLRYAAAPLFIVAGLSAYASLAISTSSTTVGLVAGVAIIFAGFALCTPAGTSIGALVVGIAFAGALAIASAAVGAIAIVAVVAAAASLLDDKKYVKIAHWCITIALLIGWGAGALWFPWPDIAADQRAIFLFLAVFPLLNALFDTLSYATTLTLLRLGLTRWNPVVAGLLDLAAAVLLFLALGATLTLVLAGMNHLAGPPLIDLTALLSGARNFQPQDYWLYAMLFSTMVPTALHAILALIGLQSIVPAWLRMPVANLMEAAPQGPFAAIFGPFLAAALATVPIAIATLILWGLWHVTGDAILIWVDTYFTWLMHITTTWDPMLTNA